MKHRCGHQAVLPPYMGRGAARQRRIAAYLERVCPRCAVEAARRQCMALTNLDGSPAPLAYRERKLADRLAALRRIYGAAALKGE